LFDCAMRKNGINKRKVKAPFFILILFQKENKMRLTFFSFAFGWAILYSSAPN
jgi:hypothetical protein